MLTRIDLRFFKCFELVRLPLAHLTLLSGSNASGKSSVLQALVLLHQTMREHEWSARLMLNGADLRLGTVSDVVDKVHGRVSFEVGLADEESSIQWTFVGDRFEMSMEAEAVTVGGTAYHSPVVLRYLLPHDVAPSTAKLRDQIRALTYITAERVGPREVYNLDDRRVATVVGAAGEHAVSVLHWGRDEQVIPSLALPTVPSTRLRQVEARMRTFFPGFALDLQEIAQANALTLGLRTSDDTSFHRPINVGFGLTQVFPIVVAALSAQPGELILIENPEVHLHPAGQALMGEFLATVAKAGVQVIVETHSDHVLNGIRRSIKSQLLAPSDVTVHFFRPRGTAEAQVVTPTLDHGGGIDHWPKGFFDQFEKDTSYFAGWGG